MERSLQDWNNSSEEPLSWLDRRDRRIQVLQGVAKSNGRIAVDYRKQNGEFHAGRWIRPQRLFRKAGHVYCEAFCELRWDTRHFRIDRISAIYPGDASIASREPHGRTVVPERKGVHIPWGWIVLAALVLLWILSRL